MIFPYFATMKRTMITLLVLLAPAVASARPDSLLVVFWNTENFFLNTVGFETKCNAISKIIFRIADDYGRLPDAIGLAEVENAEVLKRLVGITPLRKAGYSVIHFESPDHRGIDCALLYRKSSLELSEARPVHIVSDDGEILPTRDILLARFDSLAILVNHHPSKVGDDSEKRRDLAMARLQEVCDSLDVPWIATGDFNEDLWGDPSAHDTIKYNGKWEKIDGCFLKGFAYSRESVLVYPSLLEKDRAYGGMKPRRCFIGPRYNGGVSDHLPIAVVVGF